MRDFPLQACNTVKRLTSYWGFPKETPALKFRLLFFFVRSQIAFKSSSRMRNLLALTHAWCLTNEHMSWCSCGRREAFAVQNQTLYNALKTHTRYAHIVRDRPTRKDVERFRNESVREPYERSLYERKFMSEPFIEKHAISTELSNVNREKHRRKSHRVSRRDREPSRIPIQSLKRLRKKSREVRKFVYALILSCISMSSTLYCYVNAKKLLN